MSLADGRFSFHQRGDALPTASWEAPALWAALWGRAHSGGVCCQDARREPLPGLDAAAVCSYYAQPIGAPATALLVLIHTNAAPRGFTALCRDLGVQLATTADTLIATARLREHLQDELRRVAWIARTDPVTGYGNRRAWDEAVAQAENMIATGAPVGVITVDLNDLKPPTTPTATPSAIGSLPGWRPSSRPESAPVTSSHESAATRCPC